MLLSTIITALACIGGKSCVAAVQVRQYTERQASRLTWSVCVRYSHRAAVNMSPSWCCVVCQSVILLSLAIWGLPRWAQSTVDDESSQCDSASLQQVANMVSVIASNLQEMKDEMKRLVLSRPTECECATVKPTEYSTYPAVTTSTSPPEHSTVQPSKQQLVSALVCEYLVPFWFHYTDLTRVTERITNAWDERALNNWVLARLI